jgi:hypothetical protein
MRALDGNDSRARGLRNGRHERDERWRVKGM